MFTFHSGELSAAIRPGAEPVIFGFAREVSLSITSTTTAIYGMPTIGSGTRKLTGKAEIFILNRGAFHELFPTGSPIVFGVKLFGNDPTTGKRFSMLLYNCLAERSDFVPDDATYNLGFQAFSNACGQVCQLNFGDAA